MKTESYAKIWMKAPWIWVWAWRLMMVTLIINEIMPEMGTWKDWMVVQGHDRRNLFDTDPYRKKNGIFVCHLFGDAVLDMLFSFVTGYSIVWGRCASSTFHLISLAELIASFTDYNIHFIRLNIDIHWYFPFSYILCCCTCFGYSSWNCDGLM